MASQELIERVSARKAVECRYCGATFFRSPSRLTRGRGQFCNRQCRDRFGVEAVQCRWPGCCNTSPGRRFFLRRGGDVWKTDLRRKGDVNRFPFCGYHRELAAKFLPDGHRLQNGHFKWFSDPGVDLGHRAVTSVASLFVVWAKTQGHCADCGIDLDLNQRPRLWNCDHRMPIFRGGKTNYWNMWPLCGPCHAKKSALEKSEASRTRHREQKARRWLTHTEKDALIEALRNQIIGLRVEIASMKEPFHGKVQEGVG